MKFFAITIAPLLLLFSIKLYPLTDYNSKFYKLKIDSETKTLIDSLRLNSYRGRLYNAVFALNKKAAKYKATFLSLMARISKNRDFKFAHKKSRKADILLTLLHKYLFKAYVGDDPFISSSFERGVFNCVSSTIIYNMAADYFNIKSSAAVVPSHIFSVVHDDIDYDVETTLALGFDPGKKREIRDKFKQLTGFVYVNRSSSIREHITNNTLLAYMFSQEGNVYGERKQKLYGLKFFVISLMIDPGNKPAVAGIKIAYNSLATEELKKGNLNKSVKIMNELSGILNTREASYAAVANFNNIIASLDKKGDFNAAIKLLNDFKNSPVLKNIVSELLPKVYANYSGKLFNEGKIKEAIDFLKTKENAYPKLKEVISVLYHDWITKLSKERRFKEALEIIKPASLYSSNFASYIRRIYGNWIYYCVQTKKYGEGYLAVKEFYIKSSKSQDAFNDYFNYLKLYVKVIFEQGNGERDNNFSSDIKTYLKSNHLRIIKDYFYWSSVISNLNKGRITEAVLVYKKALLSPYAGRFISGLKKKISYAVATYSRKHGKINTLISDLNLLKGITDERYLNEAFALAYYFMASDVMKAHGASKAVPLIYEGLSFLSYSRSAEAGLYNLSITVLNSYLGALKYIKAADFVLDIYFKSNKKEAFASLVKNAFVRMYNHLSQNNNIADAKKVRDLFIKRFKGESGFENTLGRMNP